VPLEREKRTVQRILTALLNEAAHGLGLANFGKGPTAGTPPRSPEAVPEQGEPSQL